MGVRCLVQGTNWDLEICLDSASGFHVCYSSCCMFLMLIASCFLCLMREWCLSSVRGCRGFKAHIILLLCNKNRFFNSVPSIQSVFHLVLFQFCLNMLRNPVKAVSYKHLGASIVPNRSKQTHKIASGFAIQWNLRISYGNEQRDDEKWKYS